VIRLPRLPLAALAGLAAVLASACQVRTTVTVDVAHDGSGTVEVAVGLDADAVGRLPDLDDDGLSTVTDLAALVRRADLVAAGWEVADPAAGDGDMAWIRATKPFGTPEEADRILAEVAGPDGALRDLQVSRAPGFGRTSYGFSGTVDLRRGLEAFGDERLATALDGQVLGQGTAEIEQELGQPLADVFAFEVSAHLPGGAGSTWSPRLGDGPLAMAADGTVYEGPVIALTAIAVAAAVALVGVVGARLVRRRRATPAPDADPDADSDSDAGPDSDADAGPDSDTDVGPDSDADAGAGLEA
jgi:hypothetical protein